MKRSRVLNAFLEKSTTPRKNRSWTYVDGVLLWNSIPVAFWRGDEVHYEKVFLKEPKTSDSLLFLLHSLEEMSTSTRAHHTPSVGLWTLSAAGKVSLESPHSSSRKGKGYGRT